MRKERVHKNVITHHIRKGLKKNRLKKGHMICEKPLTYFLLSYRCIRFSAFFLSSKFSSSQCSRMDEGTVQADLVEYLMFKLLCWDRLNAAMALAWFVAVWIFGFSFIFSVVKVFGVAEKLSTSVSMLLFMQSQKGFKTSGSWTVLLFESWSPITFVSSVLCKLNWLARSCKNRELDY